MIATSRRANKLALISNSLTRNGVMYGFSAKNRDNMVIPMCTFNPNTRRFAKVFRGATVFSGVGGLLGLWVCGCLFPVLGRVLLMNLLSFSTLPLLGTRDYNGSRGCRLPCGGACMGRPLIARGRCHITGPRAVIPGDFRRTQRVLPGPV